MSSSIEQGADGYRRAPNQPAAAMVGTTSGDGDFLPDICLHVAEGETWADPDGDGYPTDVHLDIACSFQRPNAEITASGSLTVGDTNPVTPGFDSLFDLENLDVLIVSTGGQLHITGDASDTNSSVGGVAGPFILTHHENSDTVSETRDLTGDVLYERIHEDYVWDMVLSATDFIPGSDVPGGTLDVSGRWDVDVLKPLEEIDQSSGTTVTTTQALTLDPTCSTNITAGTVSATFGGADGDAAIIVTWTGCGTHTVDFTASN